MKLMKYVNRQNVTTFVAGFVVGMFWFQFTAWAQGMLG